ncbi:hypothetical protein EGW08_011540 [Elysia chlorotica]|uniref:Uncharacterized protein n=1 Tax=Elysia chlorotica TaxID=188477 RepID=A0A433TGJ4_ELYCH|nr:hypothetical protein EGW08_011540 [Elysia chlorotica]
MSKWAELARYPATRLSASQSSYRFSHPGMASTYSAQYDALLMSAARTSRAARSARIAAAASSDLKNCSCASRFGVMHMSYMFGQVVPDPERFRKLDSVRTAEAASTVVRATSHAMIGSGSDLVGQKGREK